MFSSILRYSGVCGLAAVLLFAQPQAQQKQTGEVDVTRATLDNGMRVVIVRDPLAPVVTVEENYLVGGNETPTVSREWRTPRNTWPFADAPDLSGGSDLRDLRATGRIRQRRHAAEYHPVFHHRSRRRSGHGLAPGRRLHAKHVRIRRPSGRRRKAPSSRKWRATFPIPTYKFITRLNEDMFSGTPYSHDALGTKDSFDATTGEMLKEFYTKWYAPNNAILVIAGDVDPNAALAKVKEFYGKHSERKTLPPRPEINLQPVKPESFTLDSNLPYLLAFIAYRMPGTDSPDFAAVQILERRADQPARQSVRAGSAGKGAGHGIRRRRGLSRRPAWPIALRPCPPRRTPRR